MSHRPDALEAFDRNGADLVLLDLVPPGTPGTEVRRSLRARSDVPVIMMSARGTEIDKAAADLGSGSLSFARRDARR